VSPSPATARAEADAAARSAARVASPTRRPAAPARRVSGPARPARPARTARPARSPERPPASRPAAAPAPRLAPFAQHVTRIADHSLLDRLIRGRTWIGLVAFALIGIVAMQVALLRLNAGIGSSIQRATVLQRESSLLTAQVAGLSAAERIQTEAAKLGMVYPPPGDVRYLHASPGDAARAVASIVPPAAGTTGESGPTSTSPSTSTSTSPSPSPSPSPSTSTPGQPSTSSSTLASSDTTEPATAATDSTTPSTAGASATTGASDSTTLEP
jgi:hypothetical protein